MVYKRWYLVNPNVQMAQNMYGKGGRGSFRPSCGRPKLTLFSRFVATQFRCYGSKSLRQFSSERSEIESTWAHKPGAHVDLISDLSNENWRSDFDPLHLGFFCDTTGFWPMNSLWAALTSKRRLRHPLSTTFSESWVRKDSVISSPENISGWKFLGTGRFTQKITFSRISVHTH